MQHTHSLSGLLVCMKSKPTEQMDNEVDHKKLIKAIKIGFWLELQKPKAPSSGETLNL